MCFLQKTDYTLKDTNSLKMKDGKKYFIQIVTG